MSLIKSIENKVVFAVLGSLFLMSAEKMDETLIYKCDFSKNLVGWTYNSCILHGPYKLYTENGKMIIECLDTAKAQILYNLSDTAVIPGATYELSYKVRTVGIERMYDS